MYTTAVGYFDQFFIVIRCVFFFSFVGRGKGGVFGKIFLKDTIKLV